MGQAPLTATTGETADISHLVELTWYQPCWFWNPPNLEGDQKLLGRWFGPSFDVGQAVCSEILTEKGGLRHTSSYCPLTPEELKSPIVLARLNKLDELAVQKFGEPGR